MLATLFVSEEGFGIDAPALLGPKAQAVSGAAITTADASKCSMPMRRCPRYDVAIVGLPFACVAGGWQHQAQAGEEALQLMTVHSAKGLEFDAVFNQRPGRGIVPHENSQKEDAGVEEERRLM